MEYYSTKPIAPAEVDSKLHSFIDGAIDLRGTGVTEQNAAQNVTVTEFAERGVLIEFAGSEVWLPNVTPGHITFENDFL